MLVCYADKNEIQICPILLIIPKMNFLDDSTYTRVQCFVTSQYVADLYVCGRESNAYS